MLLPLLFATQQLVGPMLAAGSNADFYHAVSAVEEKLAAGDFKGAKSASALLPKKSISIQWDDSKVPAGQREAFAKSRDAAITQWSFKVPGLAIALTTSGHPDIRFSFENQLATPAGRSMPSASVLFFSDSSKEPRLECVIGLKRGDPIEPLNAAEVVNEVMYGLGSYFGLAPSPLTPYVMGRTDQATGAVHGIGLAETLAVQTNFKAVSELLKAIETEKRLSPSHPSFFLDPPALDLGTVTQGQRPKFSFQVTNRGDSPLEVRATPDCSCVGVEQPKPLAAGMSTLVQGLIDTRELNGDISRRVIVATNDPDHPYREVPLKVHVNPLYKFDGPVNQAVNLGEGSNFDVTLSLSPATTMKVTAAHLTGVRGTADFEQLGGGQKGYRVKVHIDEDDLLGRRYGGVQITTDDQNFPWLAYNFTVQKGLVAVPSPLFLGNLKAEPRQFMFEVTRPHQPFKVEKIDVDVPHLTAVLPTESSDAIKITLHYDGKADSGIFKGTIKVFTNDPVQKVIDVPFSASVL